MLKRLLIIASLTFSAVGQIDAATVQADTNFPIDNPASVFDSSHAGNGYALGSGSTFDNPGPGSYDVGDIFGGTFGTYAPELGNAVFADNQAQGTIVTVQVTLPSAVSLKSYKLWLAEDTGNNGHRSTRQFQLFAGSTLADTVNILDTSGSQSYTGVYRATGVEVESTLNAPDASSYTLLFVQNQAAGDVSGLRVVEFQAFVPEPASLALLGIGCATGLRAMRRGRR